MMNPTVVACLLCLTWPFWCSAADAPHSWHEVPGGRWREMKMRADGKPGFSLLSPAETGITFANNLDPHEAAANRVLLNGSGVAIGDYDADGLPDIYLCSEDGSNQLYKNLGDFQFKDVTHDAGVSCENLTSRGAVFADVNGDGFLDLLVATTGNGVRLFLNDGHGHFRDGTKEAGLETTSAAVTLTLADTRGTGSLDLYVANNRPDDVRDRGHVEIQQLNGRLIVPRGLQDRFVMIKGRVEEYGQPGVLYFNDGHGHFTAASWTDGKTFLDEHGKPLTEPPRDWGLTAAFRDLNGDGAPDLYACDDYWTPDRIWINDGKGHFRAIAPLAIRHTTGSSMGVDFANLDDSDLPSIFVLDMLSRTHSDRIRRNPAQQYEPHEIGVIDDRPQLNRNTLLYPRGDGTYAEIAYFAGLTASEWSWQPTFLDVDLDGHEDLIITAGHARDVQDADRAKAIENLHLPATPQNLFRIAEMSLLYNPGLIAYHNLGNCRFQEAANGWGLDQPGVCHGIATADLDGSGALSLVVNRLNQPAAVYRNNASASRVAVRLKGLPGNIQGIGAKVALLNGATPRQCQEIMAGGRYLSGSEPTRVFAAGAVKRGMRIEVTWRSGQRSLIDDVRPNRLYEIDEISAEKGAAAPALNPEPPTLNPPAMPLFEDLSNHLGGGHTHHESDFVEAELARQPLLPKLLSRLGPGVAWCDLRGSGHEDLIVSNSEYGRPSIFFNDGTGAFTAAAPEDLEMPLALISRGQTGVLVFQSGDAPTLLVGSSNYQDARDDGASAFSLSFHGGKADQGPTIPGFSAMTGALTAGDVYGNGQLCLFVGGRVLPGKYPQAASSRLFREVAGNWVLDEKNSKALAGIGLVSGALFVDLNGDGFPDLILACEWGPVKVFLNDGKGNLIDSTDKLGLAKLTGWWNGVNVIDADHSGRLSILATNWGLNTPYQSALPNPPAARLYFGDFEGKGPVDLLEAEFDPAAKIWAPRLRLSELALGMPTVAAQFKTVLAYSASSISQVLGPERAVKAQMLEATTLAHTLFLNKGDHFEPQALPDEAQFAPAFGAVVADFDGDGNDDVFLSQNFAAFPTRMERADSGRGLLLRGDGQGHFVPVPGQLSGITAYGDGRGCAAADFDGDGRVDLAVAQNGQATKLYHNVLGNPGLRVKLIGPPGNRTAIGARTRLLFPDGHAGPLREIHGGGGYWSQDGQIQVLAVPQKPARIEVRWPGGKVFTSDLLPAVSQISVMIENAQQVVR